MLRTIMVTRVVDRTMYDNMKSFLFGDQRFISHTPTSHMLLMGNEPHARTENIFKVLFCYYTRELNGRDNSRKNGILRVYSVCKRDTMRCLAFVSVEFYSSSSSRIAPARHLGTTLPRPRLYSIHCQIPWATLTNALKQLRSPYGVLTSKYSSKLNEVTAITV